MKIRAKFANGAPGSRPPEAGDVVKTPDKPPQKARKSPQEAGEGTALKPDDFFQADPMTARIKAARLRRYGRLAQRVGKGVAAGALGGALGYGVGMLLPKQILLGFAPEAMAVAAGLASGYFAARGPGSLEEIVRQNNGRGEPKDGFDLVGPRSNRDYRRYLETTRKQLDDLHTFEPMTAELVKQMDGELRHLARARFVQDSGLKLQGDEPAATVAGLRRYLGAEGSNWNLVDAAKGIQEALDAGERDPEKLALAAERSLLQERGIDSESAGLQPLKAEERRQLRRLADAWSNSQGALFVPRASAQGVTIEQQRRTLALDMLKSHGYQNVEALDLRTTLSLLRDTQFEGPRSRWAIRDGVSAALAQGETDYHKLSLAGNRAILETLDVDVTRLATQDTTLREAFPDLPVAHSRARQTRLLRDLVRVLPASERKQATQALNGHTLMSFPEELNDYFGKRLSELSADQLEIKDMGPMQRASYLSMLTRFPCDLRQELFAMPEKKRVKFLAKKIASDFDVKVHRSEGLSPGGYGQDESIADWPLQGLIALHNVLAMMSGEGELTPEVRETTFAFRGGIPNTPNPWGGRDDAAGELYEKPGQGLHATGASRHLGVCYQDSEGYDKVILCDNALYHESSGGVVGISCAENTLLHELGHAQQLGGTKGRGYLSREAEQQQVVSEWSSLAQWLEPDGELADGRRDGAWNYGDPALRLGRPETVATSYACRDPIEDYAEYSVRFYADPIAAIKLSAEKFLHLNQKNHEFYSPERVQELMDQAGV